MGRREVEKKNHFIVVETSCESHSSDEPSLVALSCILQLLLFVCLFYFDFIFFYPPFAQFALSAQLDCYREELYN